eukprot:1236219-Prymnesium_polylepis.1
MGLNPASRPAMIASFSTCDSVSLELELRFSAAAVGTAKAFFRRSSRWLVILWEIKRHSSVR